METHPSVCIIGGAAVDFTGRPDGICRERDSNLGSVRMSTGGVGKNIACQLASYGYQVEFITALGMGYHAGLLREACMESGVSLSHTLTCDAHTATFLRILDEDGDMLVGVSDMSILERLTPAYLATKLPLINAGSLCVIDGNLTPEALEYLCENVTAPLYYDPVSCSKANRIGKSVGKCFAIKPNRFEAGFLSGKSCATIRGVYRASDWFIEQGVKRVFISLGSEGVFWADQNSCGVLPAECTASSDKRGAGDAMGAAIADGCIRGLSAEECARLGNTAGGLACEGLRSF